MNLDFDILRALLQSFDGDKPSLLANFEIARVNAHREQMLREGFLSGQLSAPERRPLVWDYSHTSLTEPGQRLLQLSADVIGWERAAEAYDMTEQSWSISDLADYMETRERSNGT
jgi:hypothetical protein